ncbi:hypothetical protein [Rhizobium mongolense]|jgi:hypothetical protein|uniref:Uncharacterized protein n=1 Tax=Rhizobium mongolense TaxID=57676 RepID=A0A7W6RVV3_9HYPH|nr:hypothetical protein [Rhizobium mongolense]MBB4279566.1 hypothetical protein [Rhizobium mongolense]
MMSAGEPLIAKVPHGHWKTLTFLAGLRRDSIVAPFVQRAELARLYDQLAAIEHGATVRELGHRFDALGPGSDDVEISALADDYIAHLGSWMRDFDNALSGSEKRQAATLLWLHALENTNDQQKRLLMEINSGLESKR